MLTIDLKQANETDTLLLLYLCFIYIMKIWGKILLLMVAHNYGLNSLFQVLTQIAAETFKAPLTDTSTISRPVDSSVSGEKPKSPEVKAQQDLPKDTEVKLLFSRQIFHWK